jgi:hypothetical protein
MMMLHHHHYFLRGVGARRVAAPRSSFHCWTQRQHCYYYHRYHYWVGSSSVPSTEATTTTQLTSTPQQRTSWNSYGSSNSKSAAATPLPRNDYRTYQQQYYYRSFSISRHPDPLARHGTINSLDDDDDDLLIDGVTSSTTDGDLDGGLSRGGKKVVLTADDMDYLDEFLGLESSSSTKDKKGGSAAKTKGRGMDYNNLFSSIDNDDDDNNDDNDDDEIIGHSSLRTSRNKNNKGDTMSSEEIAYAEYQRKQQAIHDELDTRTGRLWTESWTITDEEWMADETWEDIEEWKPSLATRKSLESVRVYNINTRSATNDGGGVRGVPTLTVLSTLALPTTLPPHPGHGAPTIHANHRKKTIMRQLRTSIQIVIHDDILKIMNHMSTYNERQAAVDVLYETIHDKVREREPVLCKLPNFAQLVEEGLEDVLSMVQESMTRQAKVEKTKNKKKGMMMKTTELDNEKDIATATTNGLKSVPAGGDIQKQPIVIDENIIDVMGVNIEPPIPIFMDILAATRHLHTLQQEYKQLPSSDVAASTPPPRIPPPTTNTFFATTNDVNVPNLLYPLTNHPKMGVGRMVEEWQLAANKETKRIMIRDAMKEISSIVVNATTVTTTKEVVTQQQPFSSSDDDDDVVVDSTTSTEVVTTTTTTAGGGGGGATRILVTGKRGVGKVRDRCQTSLILPILLLYCCCFTLHIQLIGTHTYYYRLPPLLGLLHLLVSLVILLFTIPMVIDCVNMGTTLNHVPIVQDCTIYLKLPRNFVTNY